LCPFITVFKNKRIINVLLLSEQTLIPISQMGSYYEQAKLYTVDIFVCFDPNRVTLGP
jgi:hypothetical protein